MFALDLLDADVHVITFCLEKTLHLKKKIIIIYRMYFLGSTSNTSYYIHFAMMAYGSFVGL